MSDPNDPNFSLASWEAARLAERMRRDEAQRRRDAAWREERRTRRRHKDGSPLGASYVVVPVPDPAPGAPRSVPVRQG